MSKFKWSKTIFKGAKGALITAGSMAIGTGVIAGDSIVSTTTTIQNELADSLAQAITTGDSKRIQAIILSALIGFAIEVVRNILKQRKLFNA